MTEMRMEGLCQVLAALPSSCTAAVAVAGGHDEVD